MANRSTALVTGASRGIGRSIALELARAGRSVAVNYTVNADAAQKVIREIESTGSKAVAIQANVADAEDRARLVEQTERQLGPIDLLVNNAGITSPDRGKDLLDASEASFDAVINTNLKAAHFLTQLIARRMIARRRDNEAANPADGSETRTIINIGSISAFAVSTDRADYCIARAATTMMTRVWAARLAPEHILVYEIRPGIIRTDMTAPVAAKYDKLIAEGAFPIERWGEPADVGRAVAMLASGALAYSTGETIHVDGGFHLRRL